MEASRKRFANLWTLCDKSMWVVSCNVTAARTKRVSAVRTRFYQSYDIRNVPYTIHANNQENDLLQCPKLSYYCSIVQQTSLEIALEQRQCRRQIFVMPRDRVRRQEAWILGFTPHTLLVQCHTHANYLITYGTLRRVVERLADVL